MMFANKSRTTCHTPQINHPEHGFAAFTCKEFASAEIASLKPVLSHQYSHLSAEIGLVAHFHNNRCV
jgi:hypothetical protein